MFRRLGTLVWGALGVFHLWLLAQQAWSGQFGHEESVRWVLALGLVGGLVALRRRGGSLFRDRRATALWVLVALLHGPVLAEGASVATQALAESPAVAVQIVGAAAGLGLTLALATRDRVRRPVSRVMRLVSGWVPPARTIDSHVGFGFLPRPPPIA